MLLPFLSVLLFSEMVLITILLFKTPLRKIAMIATDRLKQGRGPVVVSTVLAVLCMMMSSSVYSVVKIKERWNDEDCVISTTDQVLMNQHMLDATLLGASNFFALMIDRIHHCFRDLRFCRKNIEVVKEQIRSFEEGKAAGAEEVKVLKNKVITLKSNFQNLRKELEGKKKEKSAAEASIVALKKQSEGFLLEYGRLLEENQILRSQLQSLDWKVSRSINKKNS